MVERRPQHPASMLASLEMPLPDLVSQYLPRSCLHRLAGLLCRASFLVVCILTLLIVYDLCPLTVPDVGPSSPGFCVEHTSFHVGLCSKLVLCLFVFAPYVITGSTQVLYICLFRQPEACGKVAFDEIPVFGVCRPTCHVYLFVLVPIL